MVHAAKSVHAWHSHHVLLLRDAPPPQHSLRGGPGASGRSSALRRGATAMHSESLSRALQWFQTVQRSRPSSPVASARRLGRRNQEQGPEEEEEEEPSFLSSVLESFSLPSFF